MKEIKEIKKRTDRKTYVLQGDYDKYYIPISVNNLIGKNRKSYLYSELEKRHPCFNNDFCIDSIMKIINKKVVFDVIVMPKRKYMEYKKQKSNSFGIRFNNSLFSYRFVKISFVKNLLLIVFLVVVFFLGKNILKKNIFAKRITGDLNIENNLNIEDVDIKTNDDSLFETNIIGENIMEHLYEQLFLLTNEKNGKILLFEWKNDGFIEEIICNVKNVFPEDYQNILGNSRVSVEYRDKKPVFTIYKKTEIQKKKKESDLLYREKFDLHELRNELIKDEIRIVEEKSNPFSISFVCENDLSILGKIIPILEKHDICICRVVVTPNEQKQVSLSIELNLTKTYKEGFQMNSLLNYKKLFQLESVPPFKKSFVTTEVAVEKKTRKIGTIGYNNGEKLVFYKDTYGKMIHKMEK